MPSPAYHALSRVGMSMPPLDCTYPSGENDLPFRNL